MMRGDPRDSRVPRNPEEEALYQQKMALYQRAKQAIAPYYVQYLTHLTKHSECPAELAGLIDSKSDLADLRDRIAYHQASVSPLFATPEPTSKANPQKTSRRT